MSKKKRLNRQVTSKTEDKEPTLFINQINQVNVDRTPKDIKSLRTAHRSAESIHSPNRSRLYDLYADVDLDGHLTGIIAKRIAAVMNKTIKFERNKKTVDELSLLIKSQEFREIIKGIMLSLFWGMTGFEFIPGAKLEYKEIPRKHIKPERGIITVFQSDQEGMPYKAAPNFFVIGSERDLGLLLKCSFYALIKKGDFADWAQYVEIYGQPVRVIKYDAFDDKTKTELRQVLDEAGGSLTLMIPKQTEFEIMDGKQSNGDGQLQERLKNACNNEMSVIVLGNTETTSNDNGGSNAKAKEQGEQQLEITKDDIQFVLNMLNSDKFLAILKSYGYPVEGGLFLVEKQINLVELKTRSEIDKTIGEIVPIGDDYFYETYGIPKPDNYEQLKAEKLAMANAISGGDYNQPPAKPGDKPGKDRKPVKGPDKKSKLSSWENFRLWAADFFDLALRS